VKAENNSLTVSFGNLYAIATPFTEKVTILVELIPGQGRMISLKLADGGKISHLVYDKEE